MQFSRKNMVTIFINRAQPCLSSDILPHVSACCLSSQTKLGQIPQKKGSGMEIWLSICLLMSLTEALRCGHWPQPYSLKCRLAHLLDRVSIRDCDNSLSKMRNLLHVASSAVSFFARRFGAVEQAIRMCSFLDDWHWNFCVSRTR